MKKDKIKNIKDIGLCLQTLIKSRYNKNIKIIYTDGKYKSLYVSFYKNYVYQFYVQDRVNYYLVYMLRNEKIARKEIIKKDELIEQFYIKIMYFFRLI